MSINLKVDFSNTLSSFFSSEFLFTLRLSVKLIPKRISWGPIVGLLGFLPVDSFGVFFDFEINASNQFKPVNDVEMTSNLNEMLSFENFPSFQFRSLDRSHLFFESILCNNWWIFFDKGLKFRLKTLSTNTECHFKVPALCRQWADPISWSFSSVAFAALPWFGCLNVQKGSGGRSALSVLFLFRLRPACAVCARNRTSRLNLRPLRASSSFS